MTGCGPRAAPSTMEDDRRQVSGTVGRAAAWLLIMLGLAVLVYPNAADWAARRSHGAEIANYIASAPQVGRDALTQARAFNADGGIEAIDDPFEGGGMSGEYADFLSVDGSDAVGRVKYGHVGIDLPIYRGTGDDVLAKGAGHLPGTALPIGGPSTHAVLTAHSGLPGARLFTDLHDAEVGDTFWIEMLGERRWYRVTGVGVHDPNDGEALAVVPGRDIVTLFTCTPVGVNSHRILVRGERTDPPVERDPEPFEMPFPSWLVVLAVGGGAAALIVIRGGRRHVSRTGAGLSQHPQG